MIKVESLNEQEQRIYNTLSNEPIGIYLLAGILKEDVADILIHLLSLQFKGLAKQLHGKFFMRIP